MAKMFKVTDADKRLKTPAWKQLMDGNPNYMYVPPVKKAKFKKNKKTEANS
tara:strand:+ start:979 stop:1131 length:153 start_codon:yes stop_codon:yes gene_type:complete